MKMKSCLVLAITWIILQSSALTVTPVTFSLDLAKPTEDNYLALLTNIRNEVRDPSLVYGGTTIPVMREPTTTYLRIDLTGSSGTVSLGLKRSDLYVIAYLAKNDKGKPRAYYFKGQITPAGLDALFPEAKGAKNQQIIKEYGEDYKALEKAAKVDRKKAGLGINKLINYITEGVDGKARSVPNEAKFILVAVQMVSEATRFGYIQNLVLESFPEGFSPDDKVLILERNWNRISREIKASNGGAFKKPLDLKTDEVKKPWTVKNAAELNMGILKYLGK
ncbi:hypothetical protein vseg_009877 [Gypsophila vaccaria]